MAMTRATGGLEQQISAVFQNFLSVLRATCSIKTQFKYQPLCRNTNALTMSTSAINILFNSLINKFSNLLQSVNLHHQSRFIWPTLQVMAHSMNPSQFTNIGRFQNWSLFPSWILHIYLGSSVSNDMTSIVNICTLLQASLVCTDLGPITKTKLADL